jgi:hypothetical protein
MCTQERKTFECSEIHSTFYAPRRAQIGRNNNYFVLSPLVDELQKITQIKSI